MRSLSIEFLLILGVTLLGAVYGLFSGLSPRPWVQPDLPPGAIRYVDASVMDVIWLDSRSAPDFAEAHIPEALWINPDDWETGIPSLMEQWLEAPRPIIVYCSSSGCQTSQRIAEALRSALPNAEIYYLMGGWPQ